MRHRGSIGLGVALLALALWPAAAGALPRDESKPWIVVDGGTAPDGSRYQHVVYGTAFDYSVKGKRIEFRGWCKSFIWPEDHRGSAGGRCEAYGGKPSYDSPIRGIDYRFVQHPQAGNAVAQPDVVISGDTNSRTAAVKIFYTDASGGERELPVDFARLEGDRLRAAGARFRQSAQRRLAKSKRPGAKRKRAAAKRSASETRPQPYGVFTAFVPGAWGEAQRISDLAESYFNDPQQPPPLENGDLTALHIDGNGCDDREGPFRIVAYDAAGREIPRPRHPRC